MGKMINFAHVNEHGNFTAILSHFALEFTQSGSQIRMRCPFHDDETPSLSITLKATDKAQANTFHCFGCSAKGSLIDFVSKHTDRNLRDAAELVAKISACTLASPKGWTNKSIGRQKPSQLRRKPVDKSEGDGSKKAEKARNSGTRGAHGVNTPLTFTLDLKTYHEDVLRRLDQETAEYFGVGFLADTSKSMMKGRICIPIHNNSSELVAYAGRWPSEDVPDGEDKYLFPPKFNKMNELYNLHRLDKARHRHIVVVEGFFSAMRLHQLGVPVVALMGTAISDEQIDRLHHAGVKSALVLLDSDDAGRKASEVVGLTLMRRLFVRVMHLPDGCSPDDVDIVTLQAMLPFPLRNQF